MNIRATQRLSGGCILAIVLSWSLVSHSTHAQEMKGPVDVVAASDGTIYVADRALPGIWKVKDGQLEKFFEGSTKYRTPLNAVRCLAIDTDGRLLAGDSATREVYRFDNAGKATPLTNGKIGIPMAIAVRSDGELLVSDLELHCIWKVPAEGGKPVKLADVQAPAGICLDKDNQLWVVSRSATSLFCVSPDGKVKKVLEKRPFNFPHQVAIDDQGTMLITDGYASAVWKMVAGQKPTKIAEGEPLMNPIGITRSGENYLIADAKAQAILQLDKDGTVTKVIPK